MATFGTFATTRKGMLDAFRTRWDVLRPSWDHESQTAYPPRTFERDADQWIKVQTTNQGGRNRAVGILDEVGNLFTVDVFNRFDQSDLTSMFLVDALADDAHNALRSMTVPSEVDDVRIEARDFPLTDTGFEHKRVSLFFRFDLPRYP